MLRSLGNLGNLKDDFFWNFRKISLSEMNYGPVQGEFFTGSDVVDRLVGETLQNSLDVKSRERLG